MLLRVLVALQGTSTTAASSLLPSLGPPCFPPCLWIMRGEYVYICKVRWAVSNTTTVVP